MRFNVITTRLHCLVQYIKLSINQKTLEKAWKKCTSTVLLRTSVRYGCRVTGPARRKPCSVVFRARETSDHRFSFYAVTAGLLHSFTHITRQSCTNFFFMYTAGHFTSEPQEDCFSCCSTRMLGVPVTTPLIRQAGPVLFLNEISWTTDGQRND